MGEGQLGVKALLLVIKHFQVASHPAFIPDSSEVGRDPALVVAPVSSPASSEGVSPHRSRAATLAATEPSLARPRH